MRLILLILTLVTLAAAASWGTVLGVGDDESVAGGNPAQNYDGSEYRGGLWSGNDGGGAGPARFYLKFAMPTYEPDTYVESAFLYGYYNDDYDNSDDGLHDIYLSASDAWSQATITWNNQPGTIGNPIASWNAVGQSTGTWFSWEITAAMDGEYQGDGVLSLVFRAVDEGPSRRNWEYFCEKEYGPDLGFYIDYTIVPEPGVVSLFGVALGAAAIGLRRARK